MRKPAIFRSVLVSTSNLVVMIGTIFNALPAQSGELLGRTFPSEITPFCAESEDYRAHNNTIGDYFDGSKKILSITEKGLSWASGAFLGLAALPEEGGTKSRYCVSQSYRDEKNSVVFKFVIQDYVTPGDVHNRKLEVFLSSTQEVTGVQYTTSFSGDPKPGLRVGPIADGGGLMYRVSGGIKPKTVPLRFEAAKNNLNQ